MAFKNDLISDGIVSGASISTSFDLNHSSVRYIITIRIVGVLGSLRNYRIFIAFLYIVLALSFSHLIAIRPPLFYRFEGLEHWPALS